MMQDSNPTTSQEIAKPKFLVYRCFSVPGSYEAIESLKYVVDVDIQNILVDFPNNAVLKSKQYKGAVLDELAGVPIQSEFIDYLVDNNLPLIFLSNKLKFLGKEIDKDMIKKLLGDKIDDKNGIQLHTVHPSELVSKINELLPYINGVKIK